jgi:hypothetical protein
MSGTAGVAASVFGRRGTLSVPRGDGSGDATATGDAKDAGDTGICLGGIVLLIRMLGDTSFIFVTQKCKNFISPYLALISPFYFAMFLCDKHIYVFHVKNFAIQDHILDRCDPIVIVRNFCHSCKLHELHWVYHGL